MAAQGQFQFADIGGVRYSIDRDANACPLCHKSVLAQHVSWALTPPRERSKPFLEIVYSCPDRECGRHFIGVFRPSESQNYMGRTQGLFSLYFTTPTTPRKPDIPAEVESASPLFAETYTQAVAAEAYKLAQVAGPGYRKALEFVIKDYTSLQKPEKADEIRAMPLGRVIDQFVDDANVRVCAQRAAWLGNDETHYVRKWEGKDIEDLKTLLRLVMNWIHNHSLTQKYLKDMPPTRTV